MPYPKSIWSGFFKSGTVQFKPATEDYPATVVFMVELTEPSRHRGRLVEIELRHEYVIAAIINDLVQAHREKGKHLPETMG